jgi:hypothetical protein
MLGLSLAAFTKFHVIISLVAIVAGLVAMVAYARGHWLAKTMHVFLWTTVATTVTGFLFPFNGFTPAIGTGIVSSVVLALAVWALYGAKLRAASRTVYAITAVIGLYLNLFVLVVQSFLKIPALHSVAPQGNEPPFAAAQGIVLIACIALGYFSARRSRRWAAVPLAA